MTVFQHMMFNDSVVQFVQFVSALDIQLCDQLEENLCDFLKTVFFIVFFSEFLVSFYIS